MLPVMDAKPEGVHQVVMLAGPQRSQLERSGFAHLKLEVAKLI